MLFKKDREALPNTSAYIKEANATKVIALAGNPNVGKSTIFNALTGLKQHTGNWAGKTVANAFGKYTYNNENYLLADLPGTYSLNSFSKEEQIARDFICFGKSDLVVVVCDATTLERNLNLALQIKEINPNLLLCINLIDEARKKGIFIDEKKISSLLDCPIVLTNARSNIGLDTLVKKIQKFSNIKKTSKSMIKYPPIIMEEISNLNKALKKFELLSNLNLNWISLKLLEGEETFINSLNEFLGFDMLKDEEIALAIKNAKKNLRKNNIDKASLSEIIATSSVKKAEEIVKKVISFNKEDYDKKDRFLDKLFTSKLTGYPIMILALMVVFYITLFGANYPSQLLTDFSIILEGKINNLFIFLKFPTFFRECLVLGVYKVLSWVVCVMLPPMAIFFPLFTLLEDFGYLPRVAFNLDKHFKKCAACGKQALTMCMGFGCNAAGVVGARIIDSKRERLIAIITNNFVSCIRILTTPITRCFLQLFPIQNPLPLGEIPTKCKRLQSAVIS